MLQWGLTVDEGEEAAVWVVVVDEQPLLLGLEIGPERHHVRVPHPPQLLGAPPELRRAHATHSGSCVAAPHPLDRHDEPGLHHGFVRAPGLAAAQRLRRRAQQLLQALRHFLCPVAAEHQLPAPMRTLILVYMLKIDLPNGPHVFP